MELDRTQLGVSKSDSEALMDHIRKHPPAVKSISEVVNLLRAISTEQRSCNDLRSCVDKVLLNMSNIRTLRDIIERLRSVSRTNGFRFEIPSSASPETRCQLVSDMFSVKIVLGTSNMPDHSPTVLDVSIKHKEDYRSCPHLANVIRVGNFLELSNHLRGLMEMYSISGSRQSKTRIFLALQSLETDIVKMCQMYRDTHPDSSILDIVMRGMVGFLTPRLAGDRPHLAFYVSPYDLIDTIANCKITLQDKVPKDKGLHAEIGIEQRSTPCDLPISPLITNKHPIDNSGTPRFMDVGHHNSTSVQSCFVLYLKPPVPVLQKIATDICKVTGFGPSSVDGKIKNYLELLGGDKDTYKVLVGEDTHVYHLALSQMKATLVNKVRFSHPGHIPKILGHLRKQAHLNTAVSSCVRDFAGPKQGREWYFEVSCDDGIEKLNITMEHPSARGTAFLEVQLDYTGFPGCKIFTGRGDPPLCSNDFVIKVLGKCSSLPITMRKLIEQSVNNPRREPDVPGVRAPTLFPTLHPTILTPVTTRFTHPVQPLYGQSTPVPATSTNMHSMNSVAFLPTAAEPTASNVPRKAIANPMLTNLLKKETPEQEQQQRNNPMLLTLLKENSDDSRTDKLDPQVGMIGGNQAHMGSIQTNSYGFVSSGSNFPALESNLNSSSHTMPPPSYPNPATQNQFGTNPMATMSPAHIPHSPYPSQRSPMSGVDDATGPVTPTNPFGIMSPGMISPGILPGPNRGRRASRQKSHSIENHDFPTLDTPQYESQPSMESDIAMDILNLNSRSGMTPLRRTESMSPSSSASMHQPLHSLFTKNIPENPGNLNLLTRSASVNSVKSGRSISSPVSRSLRTPEAMVTLGSPPMFDVNSQRASRVKSYDSNASEFFRSSIASLSSGTGLHLGSGLDQESDPFSFDDNKNPSKISMSENSSLSNRAARPTLFQSYSFDKDETLKEYAKTKPVLFRALTGDSMVSKPDMSQFQRQLSGSSMGNSSLSATPTSLTSSAASVFDFTTRPQMTSTSITTVSEKMNGKPGAMDKNVPSNQQTKSAEIKSEKTVKRRNSNKTDDGKPTSKKRGRPPAAKDATGKKRKVESGSLHEDSTSNPPIMLNIQLSATGAPISSTITTKPQPGLPPTQKNIVNNNGSAAPSAPRNPGANAATNPPGAAMITPAFDGSLGKYLQSQKEFQKRKEMKDKKGFGKSVVAKQSFSNQSAVMVAAAPEKINAASQLAKAGSAPRTVVGIPAPRKRKPSIIDVVDKLQSKMQDTSVVTSSSPPGNSKPAAEKDSSSIVVAKAKTTLPYQKTAHGGFAGKPSDEKVAQVAVGHKSAKIAVSKMSPNAEAIQKQASFNATTLLKGNRPSNEAIGANVNNDAMHKVLKHITEAAAATTKRNSLQNAIVKPSAGKAARPLKSRSITSASTNPPINPSQRISPSQMVRTFSDTLARNAALRISPSGMVSTSVKKSPLRNSTSVTAMPSRPSSASSVDGPMVPIMKPTSISPTAAMLNASRKLSGTPADQHFITPSISPTPKRTSSPLTRVEDKFKGPHRPSPTNSRISTPIPSSPDGRLMIIDDSALSMLRDEQRPDFIPGTRANERQSPERATTATPMSPPPSALKSSGAVMVSSKRAPTPRSHITSPGLSPVAVGTPLSIDDDLMNEAVIG